MFKTALAQYHHSHPQFENTLNGRLLAANEIWQGMIDMQAERCNGENPLANRTMLFLLFSRFIHELVSDHDLRGKILNHIEQKLFNESVIE